MIEDVHASYMKKFDNPSKYSFINFAKKLIDDINFTFPNIGKKNFSLNKYIYSIEFFESIVALKIDRNKCFNNYLVKNNGLDLKIKDYRNYEINENFLNKFKFLKKSIIK